ERAPADHRLLVSPGRQRQHSPRHAPAGKALIIEKAIDLLDLRTQELGKLQIFALALRLWHDFENHSKHMDLLHAIGWSSLRRNTSVSLYSAWRPSSRCIRCVARLIFTSRRSGEERNASNSQRASASVARLSHSPRMIETGARTRPGS